MLTDAHAVLDCLQKMTRALWFTGPLYVMGRHFAGELAITAADRVNGVYRLLFWCQLPSIGVNVCTCGRQMVNKMAKTAPNGAVFK